MSPSTPHARLPETLRALADRLRPGLDAGVLSRVREALAELEAELNRVDALSAKAKPHDKAKPPDKTKPEVAAQSAPGEDTILAWCDGSCSPNPGPGGWGVLIERGEKRERYSGASPQSTNNIMEMTAAIEALRHTSPGSRVRITTDSRYLIDGITRWLAGWKRKGWRKADGEPVLNRAQWEALDALVRERRVAWEWTRGHAGHPENEEVDRLANEARLGLG